MGDGTLCMYVCVCVCMCVCVCTRSGFAKSLAVAHVVQIHEPGNVSDTLYVCIHVGDTGLPSHGRWHTLSKLINKEMNQTLCLQQCDRLQPDVC